MMIAEGVVCREPKSQSPNKVKHHFPSSPIIAERSMQAVCWHFAPSSISDARDVPCSGPMTRYCRTPSFTGSSVPSKGEIELFRKMCMCVPTYLPIYRSICRSVYLSIDLSIYLSSYLSAHVYLSMYTHTCMFM